MNADVKAQWLEALKSGRYKKIVGILRASDEHYCATGVLCEISNLGRWEPASNHGYVYITTPDIAEYAVAPTAVMRWAGASIVELERVVDANDAGGPDFPVDVIEEL